SHSNLPCTAVLTIILYCSAAPRDLHSFPTRRSSDLGGDAPAASTGAGPGGDAPAAAGGRLQGARDDRVGDGEAAGLPRRSVGDGDRKSIRLNSSHVAISYAVFCLKKKRRRR